MTSYYPLVPSSVSAPTFAPTFDGAQYTVTVTWNLFGQRYYVNCYDGSGDRIFTVPVIPSADALALASLVWDAASLRVFAATQEPHNLAVGTVVQLTLAGATPDSYNGAHTCSITSPTEFFYPMSTDPGQIVTLGSVVYIISMTAGYFNSTLVFRDGQFEVSP
jgi:hypothetical protein